MKSKILIILLICLFVFGCTKKDPKNSDDAITVQNEPETEEKQVPDVDIEEHPEDSLGVNEYRYTDYKSAYGELTPSVIDANWESFYVFSKDYVGEPQQFELDAYDMYTSITYDDYKIFTGLYKDKQGDEGYFIVKTDLSEKTVLEKLVQSSENSHLIVFIKPWSSNSEYISVGRWFDSEMFYYISRNNLSEKIEFSDF